MANKWTKTTINIPKVYTPIERVAIAQDVIDYIVERTKAGKGPGNKEWANKAAREYSKSYQKSVEFRASGKSKNVNLKLSGDMLDAIGIITDKSGAVTIGITDESQVGKAEGNIRGTYGSNTPIRGKSRPFLNLTNDELKKILQNYPLNDRVKSRAEAEAIVSTSEMAQEYLDE